MRLLSCKNWAGQSWMEMKIEYPKNFKITYDHTRWTNWFVTRTFNNFYLNESDSGGITENDTKIKWNEIHYIYGIIDNGRVQSNDFEFSVLRLNFLYVNQGSWHKWLSRGFFNSKTLFFFLSVFLNLFCSHWWIFSHKSILLRE